MLFGPVKIKRSMEKYWLNTIEAQTMPKGFRGLHWEVLMRGSDDA